MRPAPRRARDAPTLAVNDANGRRTLHVGGAAVQSAMRIDDPFALELDYTRCMMAFLLFHPQPREVCMIGLGGGSLAKFVHRRLRCARVRVIESDARVLQLARRHFALPADDARLRVEIANGANALQRDSCDVLMVDGFVDGTQAPELASQSFYDAAFHALRDPGVLVVNFAHDDAEFETRLHALERAFDGAVVVLPALVDSNILVFALRGAPARIAWRVLQVRARRLERRLQLPFTRFVRALERMNLYTSDVLLIESRPDAVFR